MDPKPAAIDQNKLVDELFEHFSRVMHGSAERLDRSRNSDLVVQTMDLPIAELIRLGQAPLAVGVFLLMLARCNDDIRPMIEAMLTVADQRKQDGVWP